MNNREEFIAWVRGKRNVVIQQEGGYLIPQKVKRAKKGFIAWLWRLLKNERGFEWVNLQEEFIAKTLLTQRALDGARFCPACHALLEEGSVYCDTCGSDTPRQ